MFEIVEAIHKALRTDSSLVFVLVVSSVFALGGGVMAWLVDQGYKNSSEYKNSRKGDMQSLLDPVIHIEPENEIAWSTRADLGQTPGIYSITVHNTGLEDVKVMRVSQKFFLAKRGTPVILKRVAELSDNQGTLLKSRENFLIHLDFNPYLDTFKEVAANSSGPTKAGVYIIVNCRRIADGKDYTFSRAYGLFNLDGVAIYPEGTSMDEVPMELKSQIMTLREVMPYLDSPENWTSVTKEISVDAAGKVHTKQH